jgi:hypothetical protein
MEQVKTVAELKKLVTDNHFVWIYGAPKEDGQSWCSDCVKSEPWIREALKGQKVITVSLDRQQLKDKENEFKKDAKINVNCVPTLIHWGTSKRMLDQDFDGIEKIRAFISSTLQ